MNYSWERVRGGLTALSTAAKKAEPRRRKISGAMAVDDRRIQKTATFIGSTHFGLESYNQSGP